jgi:cupin fold WbuC family metalloprotein
MESYFKAQFDMIITQRILDELSAKAKSSERLRANLDLRNSAEDNSQRMLNALEPGTVMPIHRHKNTSETCVCIRGHFEEYFYDSEWRLTDTIDMVPGGVVLNIEKGQWHSLKSLESGTVLLEAKDGAYRPLEGDEIYQEL